MDFSFRGAELGPASKRKLDDMRTRAAARLRSLMQKLSAKDFASGEFDNLRVLIGSLPHPGGGSSLAESHLSKALRYLRSNEVGAARYELQLLLECLQAC
jgi:hypothetical protein